MTETTTGAGRSLDRPVHAACVVAGCWCRTTRSARTEPVRRARTAVASRTIDLTAWRSVGLPVA